MPTVLRIGGWRVVVYPNDHRPVHVHVIGRGGEAVFNLHCPSGPPELRENFGCSRRDIGNLQKARLRAFRHCAAHGRQSMGLNESLKLANTRARELQARTPRVVAVRYDRRTNRIVADLSSKLTVSFSPRDAEGLEDAAPSGLERIEISPSGFGIHFPKLDADLYMPALLEGFLGSKKWMAARLGQVGGQSRSKAKRAASRENGKLGGRPRKTVRG